MKTVLLACALLICPLALKTVASQPLTEDPPDDVSGYYICNGWDIAGKPYEGVTVIRRVGEVYVVTWSAGESVTHGIGILQGHKFSVGWATGHGKDLMRGLTVYTVGKGGKKLTGLWTSLPGSGKVHSENLTLLKKIGPPPEETSVPICDRNFADATVSLRNNDGASPGERTDHVCIVAGHHALLAN